jgi:hypothetical protein
MGRAYTRNYGTVIYEIHTEFCWRKPKLQILLRIDKMIGQ